MKRRLVKHRLVKHRKGEVPGRGERRASFKDYDPLMLGAMVHKLAQERRSANEQLKVILERLERLEVAFQQIARMQSQSQSQVVQQPQAAPLAALRAAPSPLAAPAAAVASAAPLVASLVAPSAPRFDARFLPKADKSILALLAKRPRTAREVASALGYKRANAASARLNRLAERGCILKARVGRCVVFALPSHTRIGYADPWQGKESRVGDASMTHLDAISNNQTHQTTSTAEPRAK